MDELKELKEKLNKINRLLDKLDERLALGEITELRYKELSEKYRVEANSLKNLIAEKELLQEVGLNTEEKEAVEHPELEKAEEHRHAGYEGQFLNEDRKKMLSAFLWMTLLSILLFWLPFLGSFIVGFVGGKKAGNVRNVIIAGIIPIVLMFTLAVEVFGDYSSSLYTDNAVIIASVLLIPIIVVIGAIMSSRMSLKRI